MAWFEKRGTSRTAGLAATLPVAVGWGPGSPAPILLRCYIEWWHVFAPTSGEAAEPASPAWFLVHQNHIVARDSGEVVGLGRTTQRKGLLL